MPGNQVVSKTALSVNGDSQKAVASNELHPVPDTPDKNQAAMTATNESSPNDAATKKGPSTDKVDNPGDISNNNVKFIENSSASIEAPPQSTANEADSNGDSSASKSVSKQSNDPKGDPKTRRLTAFTGARLAFLQGELEKFASAEISRTDQSYLEGVNERYFRRFPETTEHNVDPCEEYLAAVDDTSEEDPHPPPPERQPGQTSQQFEEEMQKYRDLQSRIIRRQDQIARWLRYHSKNNNGQLLDAHIILLNRLVGKEKEKKPGRRSTSYNLWHKHHQNFLEPAIEEAYREAKQEFEEKRKGAAGGELRGADGSVIKAPARLRIWQDIVKAEFEKLPKQEQEEWQSRTEEDHQKRLQNSAASKELQISTDPEDRQRSIDLLHSWTMPLLQGIQKITGLNVSLFCSGPIPADQGRISVLGMHCGRIIENPCDTFGTHYREEIKKFFYPLFADFCTKTHTMQECQQLSLGPEAQLGRLFDSDAVYMERLGSEDRALVTKLKAASKSLGKIARPQSTSASSSASGTSTATTSKSSTMPTASIQKATASSRSTNAPILASSSSSGGTTSSRALPSADSRRPVKDGEVLAQTSVSVTASEDPVSGARPRKMASQLAPPTTLKVPDAQVPRRPAPVARSEPRPPVLVAASSLSKKPSHQLPIPSSSRAFPVGGSSRGVGGPVVNARGQQIASAVAGSSKAARDERIDSLDADGYRSKINVNALRRRESQVSRMTTFHGHPPKRLPGSAKNPIVLSSSPPGTPPRKRARASPLSISSRGSSPIPSPTRKACRVSSPSPSPSERTASPQLPIRPKTVAASSPPESSLPRASSPPSSPVHRLSAPAESPIRGRKRRLEAEVEDVKVEEGSPYSSASAEEISAALSGEMDASSPLKPQRSTRAQRRSQVYVEIVRPRKRVRKTRDATAEKQTVQIPETTQRGEGNAKGKAKAKEYTVDLPEGALPYLEKTLDLCSGISVGEQQEDLWQRLVTAYVAMEEEAGFKGGQLGSDGRPEAVGVWIKSARTPKYRPAVDVAKFREAFTKWWWYLAPEWRVPDGEQVELLRGEGDWEELKSVGTGPNGMTSVMAALAWWLDAVERLPVKAFRDRQFRVREMEEWEDAASDVLFSYEQMLA
ncbi:SERTA domain-containing protein 3 [Marasmius crinis-equi]|uniref:SERTA domain-containing protein 3 n=1 Tax=Marasmius crinis-equi TaxID=585013 RepID=A0ABR3FCC8_9AGAR